MFIGAGVARATPAVVQVNSSPCFTSGGTTLTCSTPSSTTTGNGLAFIVSTGISTPNEEPSSLPSGCGATWYQAVQTYPYNDVFVFYAMNITGGSCTGSVTFGSSANLNGFMVEMSGLTTTYALELATYSGRWTCCNAITFNTTGASDLVLAVSNTGPGSGTCSSMSAPASPSTGTWAAVGTPICSTTPTTGVWSSVVGPGSNVYYEQPNNSNAINSTYTIVVFRSVLPSPGRLQANFMYSGLSATSTYQLPNLVHDLLVVQCEGDNTAAPTDNASNTYYMLPSWFQGDSADFYTYWYAKNSNAYSTGGHGATVTCPTGSSIGLWEYTGLSLTAPVGAASDFFTQNDAITSYNTGSVQVNSTSVLFSAGAILENVGYSFTASSGFGDGVFTGQYVSADNIMQWDEVVSPGSYSNSIVASAGTYFPQGFIQVFETDPVTVPAIRQYNRQGQNAGPDGSATAALPIDVNSGDLLLQVVANDSGYSPGTPSDTQSNSYSLIQGGGSEQFGLYWAVAGSTGSLSSTNTDANCVGIIDISVPSTPLLDQSNSAQDTSGSATSLSTGNITITNPNELVVSVGYVISASYRLWYESQSSGWSGLVFACGGHYAAAYFGIQAQVSTGTYSNTFEYYQPMPLASAIASFKFSAGGANGSGPTFQIIGSNNPPENYWLSKDTLYGR